MKRHILTFCMAAAALLCSTTMSAQEFRWGPSIGANINYATMSQTIVDKKFGFGGTAGVRAEYMFPGIGFGLDMGLLYAQRNSSLNLGQRLIWSSSGYGNEHLSLHSIDIPFNLKFKYTRLGGFEDVVAPFVFGGPIFSIQAGHSKCDAIRFSGGEVMLTAGAGAQLYKNWQVAASFTWDMTYAYKTRKLDDYYARNRTIDLRVTYLF